jgi:Mrp family chromosome partitioning ATPase
LLSSGRLDDLISCLRSNFDYILIDSAPLSLVSDTLVLARVADISAIVFRANYSNKHWFKSINALVEEGRLPKTSLVLNGLYEEKFLQRIYATYGYGYGKYEYRYIKRED